MPYPNSHIFTTRWLAQQRLHIHNQLRVYYHLEQDYFITSIFPINKKTQCHR
ncbi:hypothetical protein HMPREF1991_02949 [Hoylesella loescheii DSM 19665 = JCM 12249 = ATCC 15930]|uniref:Uncharacterized protein n=1 Tax=Hoylesella loescheii DSM 19665 = JCM 12249 = ATCC 15930 TaxID=1122985 RepID=A0A069QDW6_HOYLO|nr:hypothetical protein HMPREF1991_02949 [Hoylesella loescheii DSM 19665 = JCM 12249 = ATCC 15930]